MLNPFFIALAMIAQRIVRLKWKATEVEGSFRQQFALGVEKARIRRLSTTLMMPFQPLLRIKKVVGFPGADLPSVGYFRQVLFLGKDY